MCRLSLVWLAHLAVAASGCDEGPPTDDAGARDAGSEDAGALMDGATASDAGARVDSATGSDAGPPPTDAGPSFRVIFATSVGYRGSLGGLAGADSECDRLAGLAGLTGTFRAWLSTGANAAAARLTQSAVPYQRTDGVQVAGNWADLIDGRLSAPINRDENGNAVGGEVWTGTLANGSAGPQRCNEWQSESGSGICGATGQQNQQWTANAVPSCRSTLRLYCVQQ